jgi:hypothetical protein
MNNWFAESGSALRNHALPVQTIKMVTLLAACRLSRQPRNADRDDKPAKFRVS